MKESLFIILAPLLLLILILGWAAILSRGTRRVSLTLRGLGLSVNVMTDSGDTEKTLTQERSP